jgi:hypothetical protein
MALRTSRPRLAVHDTRTAQPRPKQADAELMTPEHRAWRLAVCRRAGWRCQWLDDGRRCEASTQRGDRMVADHIIERADGGAVDGRGQCLCVSHNTLKANIARRARIGSPS